jgi:PiT family inorganic phosphate transporter
MALLHAGVAETVFGIVDFGDDPRHALGALCAALSAVNLWGVLAWRFGLPTSESHALISGMTGAALAQHRGMEAIHPEEWSTVLWGLLLTMLPPCLLGMVFDRILRRILRDVPRRQAVRSLCRTQWLSAAGSALAHGAQDSQKFIGVWLLGLSLGRGGLSNEQGLPLSLVLIAASLMTLGTLLGGARIIKKVGGEMTDLDAPAASASDAASTAVLVLCSLLGVPASTTHAKASAIMGTGIGRRGGVNLRIVGQMVGAWVLTFPLCGAIGFFLSLLIT